MAGKLGTNCFLIFVYITVIVVVTAEPSTDFLDSNQSFDSPSQNEDRYQLSPLASYRYRRFDGQVVPYFMKRRTDFRTRLLNLLQKSGMSSSRVNKRPFDSISYQTGLGGLL